MRSLNGQPPISCSGLRPPPQNSTELLCRGKGNQSWKVRSEPLQALARGRPARNPPCRKRPSTLRRNQQPRTDRHRHPPKAPPATKKLLTPPNESASRYLSRRSPLGSTYFDNNIGTNLLVKSHVIHCARASGQSRHLHLYQYMGASPMHEPHGTATATSTKRKVRIVLAALLSINAYPGHCAIPNFMEIPDPQRTLGLTIDSFPFFRNNRRAGGCCHGPLNLD
jgi:hypothetical protein